MAVGERVGQAIPSHQVEPHPGGGRAVIEGRPQPEVSLVDVVYRHVVTPLVAPAQAGAGRDEQGRGGGQGVLRSNTRTRRVRATSALRAIAVPTRWMMSASVLASPAWKRAISASAVRRPCSRVSMVCLLVS